MAHPLLDRHDITRQRLEQSGVQVVAIDVNDLGLAIARSLKPQPKIEQQLVFIDTTFQPADHIEPVKGFVRRVIPRTPQPPANLTVTPTGVLLYQADVNRLGGSIVNTGANPVTLVLGVDITSGGGSPVDAGAGYGSVWLAANGGSWDFRLSGSLWGGSVFAYTPAAGNSTVVGAVV